MRVRRLEVPHYRDRWDWDLTSIPDPTWEQVEAAIRVLDRFHYPWVWLHLTEDAVDREYLTVMGGAGAYWVAVTNEGGSHRRLFDPEKSSHEIQLWTSDQGFSDHEFHVTEGVELVLQIARHFGETGEPLPTATWEPE